GWTGFAPLSGARSRSCPLLQGPLPDAPLVPAFVRHCSPPYTASQGDCLDRRAAGVGCAPAAQTPKGVDSDDAHAAQLPEKRARVKAVTVILPTKATSSRVECLQRAIRSVVSQQNVQVQLIVIANGPQCDCELLKSLEKRPDLRLIHTEEAGFAAALR